MEPRSPVYENLKGTLISLPIAVGFALVCKLLRFPDMILWYFFSIPVHEFGHAIASWLGGRFAVPIGAFIPMAGFTYISLERSILVYALVLVLLGLTLYRSARERTPFLFFTALIALLVQHHLTWKTNAAQWQHTVIYSGIGAEFMLGTWLALAFFFRMPTKLHWDFFRPAALVIGTYSLTSTFVRWREIRGGISEMPLGSFISGNGDSNGDLDRLILEHSWTVNEVIQHFNHLGNLCAGLLVFTYAVCVLNAWRKSRE